MEKLTGLRGLSGPCIPGGPAAVEIPDTLLAASRLDADVNNRKRTTIEYEAIGANGPDNRNVFADCRLWWRQGRTSRRSAIDCPALGSRNGMRETLYRHRLRGLPRSSGAGHCHRTRAGGTFRRSGEAAGPCAMGLMPVFPPSKISTPELGQIADYVESLEGDHVNMSMADPGAALAQHHWGPYSRWRKIPPPMRSIISTT